MFLFLRFVLETNEHLIIVYRTLWNEWIQCLKNIFFLFASQLNEIDRAIMIAQKTMDASQGKASYPIYNL